MSKRIANCRGRSTSRFGRIRYGWRVHKAATDLERVNKQLIQADIDEKLRVKYENFKTHAKSILPKRLLRRMQNR